MGMFSGETSLDRTLRLMQRDIQGLALSCRAVQESHDRLLRHLGLTEVVIPEAVELREKEDGL